MDKSKREPGAATGAKSWAEVAPDFKDYVLAGLDIEAQSTITTPAVKEAYRLAAEQLRRTRR